MQFVIKYVSLINDCNREQSNFLKLVIENYTKRVKFKKNI